MPLTEDLFSDGLSFSIDGIPSPIGDWRLDASSIPGSNAWTNNTKAPVPFDQQFYLVIGLGVGGRNSFTYDTPWERTSPLMRREFYRVKDRWYPSWTTERKGLEVKSVKVFAV